MTSLAWWMLSIDMQVVLVEGSGWTLGVHCICSDVMISIASIHQGILVIRQWTFIY
jgi:hypothetical protein